MSEKPAVHILIVDDLEENLLALEAALRGEGRHVLRAKSGREALELLLTHDVALALLDVQMPEMDGFELAELMRGSQRTRDVPIIFLTAGAHDAARVFRGYEIGAVDFLFKPLDPVLLGHKVNTFVELHRKRLELAEMLQVHEMFVAAVSHDLRSPLSTVITGTSMFAMDLPPEALTNVLGTIRSSARRMLGMLEQLYDLSRARVGGGIQIEAHEMDFRALAEKVLEELRLAHPERRLLLDDDGAKTEGRWDETRLGQVLTNLIGNALRHGTPDEDVRVTLRGASEAALFVEVRNGGEIPAALQPRLFDPFQRGHARGHENLGLGLYIVRQIVAAHGGTIELTSSKETGTRFSIQLPWTC